MTQDLRGTDTWNDVEQHFRRIHEPAFGSPHRLLEPSTNADGSIVAVTGFVYDELEGLARRHAYIARDRKLSSVDAEGPSSANPRFSPDGTRLAVLTEATEEGVFQLVVTDASGSGDRLVAPEVPGTVEYLAWAPDGSAVLLGVAGRGADLSGAREAARRKPSMRTCPSGSLPRTTAPRTMRGARSSCSTSPRAHLSVGRPLASTCGSRHGLGRMPYSP